MITGSIAHLPPANRSPDVVVVGAGAVGIVLAVQLARAGQVVTVIEGGPADPPADYRAANRAASTGRAHLGLGEGRMQALGGTTRLWGGQLVAFSAADLAPATYPGKRGWPISHADLARATDRALDLLGVPPAMRDPVAVWRAASGQSEQLSPDIAITATGWLPQPDFARLFARDLADLPGLAVLTGHRVVDCTFAAPGRVSAVVLAGPTGRHSLGAARVVLANGTLELVGLLLRLARDHPACGFAGNSHLGQGFIDHLHGVIGHFARIDRRAMGALLDPRFVGGRKFLPKLHATPAFQERAGIANVAAMVLAPIGAREALADLRTLVRRAFAGRAGLAALRGGVRNLVALAPLVARHVLRRQGARLGRGALLGIEAEQVACPESRITLDPADPTGFALHWALDGAEMRAITQFATALRDHFAATGLGDLVLDPRVVAGDPAFLALCHDAYHQMGGARMAASADAGVVDADGKVFGTENLYLLGAATFPSGSFANPTLTALALAMRLADHLAEPAR